MDRRSFLQAALTAGAAAPAVANAQAYGAKPADAPAVPPPAFPPPDARSVWLVGDSAPPDPVAVSARLAALTAARGSKETRDGYLAHGAIAALEGAFATLLGKEDCAFFTTGTQANTVAVRVLCGEDHHAICQHESHLYWDESDAVQRIAGINLVPLASGRAAPTAAEVATAIDEAENGPYALKVGAIALESPVRRQKGETVPVATVTAIATLAKAHGARLHLDAARLMLAPPTLDLKAYVAPFDTVYVSLYKYLDAPFGAVLAGSKAHIDKAREYRHLYGGLIYQGWPAALLALDSLKTFPGRNARAHATAERLIAALEKSGKVKRTPAPNASNIFELQMSETFASAAFERGRAAGVRIGRWEAGAIPVFVNDTINRRPVEEYVALFLG